MVILPFPKKLKIAKVILFFKKDDKLLMDNYRPVSLVTSISKVFEKVAHQQLTNYFTRNKLFYKSQYGFRAEHSTEFASLELVDRVIESFEKKTGTNFNLHGPVKGFWYIRPQNIAE